MRDDNVPLLRRFAKFHDQAAFTELVRRNTDLVYSAALRRVGGESHLAHDVAQQVFVTLARRAEELADHPVLTAWLYKATRNAALNAVRSESRRRIREREAHAMNETLPHQRNGVDWDRAAPVLDEVIDELNEKDRRTVLLRFFEQRTFPEIATLLRLTDDAARMRVERALEKLRTRLARRGIGSTSAALAAALTQNMVLAAPSGLATAAAGAAISALEGPAPFLAWLQFERFAAVTGVVVFLATVGLVFHRQAVTADAVAALAAEDRAITNLEHRVRELEQRADSSARAAVRSNVAADVSRAAPMVNRLRPEKRAGGRRLEVSATYDAFYRSLGLTTVQIEQFEAILVRSPGLAVWRFELHPLEPVSIPSASPVLPDAVVETDLRALLGEAGYERYRDYNRALPARNLAAQLASAVYRTDPLTATQGEQLTRIISHSSDTYQSGGTIDRTTLDWAAIVTQAGEVLSPGQLAALSGAVRQEEAFLIALMQRLKSSPAATPAVSY